VPRHPLIALFGLVAFAAALVVVRTLTDDDGPQYEAGQCTSWAHAKRPDLTDGTDGLAAGDWEDWARANGYRVDARPQPGDVAVWRRNVDAGPLGHVAYVESVNGEGVFVSEQNRDGCRELEFRRLTPSRISTATFIHRQRE
jgi:surface antigen